MAGYIGTRAAVASPGTERKKTFAITTSTTNLTGLSYTPGFVHVYHNGIRLVDSTDYTATDGSTITLTTAAENGDEVVVVSYGTFSPADTYTKTEADGRYVNVSGDTMTGDLILGGARTYFGKDGGNFHWLAASDIPSEPNRLAYGFGSDGSTVTNQSFVTNGVERMGIDSSGRVTMPHQPRCLVTCNGGWRTLTTGTAYGISDGSFLFNNGGFYNGGQINGFNGVHVPVSGWYRLDMYVYYGNGCPAGARLSLFRNNSEEMTFIQTTSASDGTTFISRMFYMYANDFVNYRVAPPAFPNFTAYFAGNHSMVAISLEG